MNTLSFFIPCIPPKATSQQKGVQVSDGKPRFFKKKHVQQAENDLISLLRPHAPSTPIEGPISLSITFLWPWRAIEKKAIKAQFLEYPIEVRPDLSNLIKLAEDTMTLLGFWKDDGQVSTQIIRKRYSDKPGLRIIVKADTDSMIERRMGEKNEKDTILRY